MVRGERDYTQRVLATVNPASLMAGRVLILEDFESAVSHIDATTGSAALTSTDSEVWRGEASMKFDMTADITSGIAYTFPCITMGELAAEVLFHPKSGTLSAFTITFQVWDGTLRHVAACRIYYDGSNVLLQVNDDTASWKTITTLGSGVIFSAWHLFCFKFNLTTHEYGTLRFDSTYLKPSNQPYQTSSSTICPNGLVSVTGTRAVPPSATVIIDDLIITYEDL